MAIGLGQPVGLAIRQRLVGKGIRIGIIGIGAEGLPEQAVALWQDDFV